MNQPTQYVKSGSNTSEQKWAELSQVKKILIF